MSPGRIAVAFLLLAAFSAANAQGKAEKRYSLGAFGAFVVSVPAGWVEQVKQDDKVHPPTISYSLGAGKEPQVIVTPVWRSRPDAPPVTKESLRQNVEQAAKAIRDQAVEKDIPVVELNGKSGPGYYFEATDKAPKPGEFRFLRQGMLKVGDLLVAFTILANSKQEPVVRDAMQVLQSAAHKTK
jgi:hypothetical protein